jgi:hypothetical protein
VIVVRFPPRLVLAASVLGVFAAGGGAVLALPERAAETGVPLPEITAGTQQQAPAPAAPAAAGSPAITGQQIAALALTPARDRAAALIKEQAQAEAEAERTRAARNSDGRDDRWQELRDEIREACDDGRIRGQICRSG